MKGSRALLVFSMKSKRGEAFMYMTFSTWPHEVELERAIGVPARSLLKHMGSLWRCEDISKHHVRHRSVGGQPRVMTFSSHSAKGTARKPTTYVTCYPSIQWLVSSTVWAQGGRELIE